MGSGSYSSTLYSSTVDSLHKSGKAFASSRAAHDAGGATLKDAVEDILDPRKLKDGMRESCYDPNFNDATPVALILDCTGSMKDVPAEVQKALPTLIDLMLDQGISDHPNVLFIAHDDENVWPRAGLQMSQFEIEAPKLVEALDKMIITGNGGGNMGESYHAGLYALAYHTKLECFDRDGLKGYAFMVCDEEPYFDRRDWRVHGMTPKLAKDIFGDDLQGEISMLEIAKKVVERYHLFVIRPALTTHGKSAKITEQWRELLSAAGESPQNVIEVKNTDEIVTTMALSIARLNDVDHDTVVDVLTKRGAIGLAGAIAATKDIVPVANGSALTKSTMSKDVATKDAEIKGGRERVAAV